MTEGQKQFSDSLGGGYDYNKSRYITGGKSMQKKCNKKIRLVSIMLAVVMVLSVLVPAPAVEAAGKPSAPKSLNCRVCFVGNMAITNYATIQVKNFPKGAKIKNPAIKRFWRLRMHGITMLD